ncbi:MAG: hypothetical protein Q7T55_23705 [Solirubrobacteraceae bacterium]|nr:hypothetical protein [Solirubrobacteraceae bacterium]
MVPTRRRSIALFTTLTVAAAAPAVAIAGGGHDGRGHGGPGGHGPVPSPSPAASPGVSPAPSASPVASPPTRPESIALPNGFSPEGIASGPGGLLYAGSLSTGAVYRADPRTGQGSILVPPQAGRISQGLKVAGKALVVAGGTTGHAYVYNAKTGANVADLTLTTGNAQINDVAIGAGAAWFTDSRQQQLYRVSVGGKASGGGHHGHGGGHGPRSKADHALSRLSFGSGHSKGKGKARGASDATLTATTVPITGDLAYDADPSTFEANGIEVLNRSGDLLIVQSHTGKVFKVDGDTGVSKEVPLTGGDLLQGDGILLKGNTLYVVKNRVNQIAVVKLDMRATSGVVERTITSPRFRVPTTVARIGGDLFAVNARFGTPSTPETDYDIVRVAAK